MRFQEWSTPDQTIWSQCFGRATPRLTGTNALSVSPYRDDTAEDPKAAGSTQAKSAAKKKKERPHPYSRQAPICLR